MLDTSSMPRSPSYHAAAVIILTTAVALLGFQGVSPSLPGMRDELGIPTTQIGWVMTAYALPAFVFVPLFGLWGDRFGKKVILVPSLVLFGVAGGGIAFAPDAASMFVLRVLQGIGGSALITLNYALLGDFFTGPQRTRLAGWTSIVQNAGSSAIPIGAGILAAIAWYWPFAACWLALPIAIYTWFWLHEPPSDEGGEPRLQARAFFGHAWRNLTSRPVVETLIMTAVFIFVGFGALITYLPLYMADTFGASEVVIGLVMGARAISGVMTSMSLVWLERRMSQRTLIVGSFVVMAISVGLVPFAPNTPGILVSSILYGAAFSVLRPSFQMMLLDLSPSNLRATLSSAGTFFLRLGQAVSPIAAGAYLAFGSYDGMYLWFAGLSLGFAVYAFFAKALAPK
jgi:MFS transporter, ACDE family, multidrug resistance protein